jgi:hypothetical protein
VTWVPALTEAGANAKAVLYNATGTVKIAEGTATTGIVSNTPLVLPFAAGQALTAGTTYWMGVYHQNGGGGYYNIVAGAGSGWLSSGGTWPTAPATISPTGNAIAPLMWGNLSAITDRKYVLDQIAVCPSPPSNHVGYLNYVFEDTVGERDSYNPVPLVSTPASVALVAVKALMGKSDGGARTVDLELKSAAVFGAGNNAGISPAAPMGWYGSYFFTDPNTAAAWTGANASAAKPGFKVAS